MTTGTYRSVPMAMRLNTESWMVAFGGGGASRGLVGWQIGEDFRLRIWLLQQIVPDAAEVIPYRRLVRRLVVDLQNIARLVSVVAREPLAGIVEFVERIDLGIDQQCSLGGEICQAVGLRPIQHPVERHIGKSILWIPSADIGMNPGEPDLADALAVAWW